MHIHDLEFLLEGDGPPRLLIRTGAYGVQTIVTAADLRRLSGWADREAQ